MRRIPLLVLTSIGIAALALPGATDPGPPPGQTLLSEPGAQLFRDHCAACHGLLGLGDGPVAASLKVRPADLTRIALRRGGTFPEADIAAFIDGRFELDAHGTREMPIWGRRLATPLAGGTGAEVARGQIQMLVEHLKTIQQPQPKP